MSVLNETYRFVEVCPVDCFYEGENMLVINPDECIDCGVCEPSAQLMQLKLILMTLLRIKKNGCC